MKRFLIPLLIVALPAAAQTPPVIHTIQLSEQQIEGIINAGAACLEKTPYACAQYTLYIRDMLNQARQPKPEPKKEP